MLLYLCVLLSLSASSSFKYNTATSRVSRFAEIQQIRTKGSQYLTMSSSQSHANDAAPIEKETPDSFASSVKRFAIFNSVIAGLLYVLSRFGTKGEGSLAQIRTVGMLAIGIQWLVFVHAGGLLFGNERTEKFYDLTGALTYISCTTLSLYKRQQSGGALSDRQTILALFVFVWCSRLGSFLFKRILKDGHDSRFTVIKKSLLRFLTAWTLQGKFEILGGITFILLTSYFI